jgi:hypothetical protein
LKVGAEREVNKKENICKNETAWAINGLDDANELKNSVHPPFTVRGAKIFLSLKNILDHIHAALCLYKYLQEPILLLLTSYNYSASFVAGQSVFLKNFFNYKNWARYI